MAEENYLYNILFIRILKDVPLGILINHSFTDFHRLTIFLHNLLVIQVLFYTCNKILLTLILSFLNILFTGKAHNLGYLLQ